MIERISPRKKKNVLYNTYWNFQKMFFFRIIFFFRMVFFVWKFDELIFWFFALINCQKWKVKKDEKPFLSRIHTRNNSYYFQVLPNYIVPQFFMSFFLTKNLHFKFDVFFVVNFSLKNFPRNSTKKKTKKFWKKKKKRKFLTKTFRKKMGKFRIVNFFSIHSFEK